LLARGVPLANERRDSIGDESRDVFVVVDDHRSNAFALVRGV
jgi:hypothetical protein